jgi:hypothetical protein
MELGIREVNAFWTAWLQHEVTDWKGISDDVASNVGIPSCYSQPTAQDRDFQVRGGNYTQRPLSPTITAAHLH